MVAPSAMASEVVPARSAAPRRVVQYKFVPSASALVFVADKSWAKEVVARRLVQYRLEPSARSVVERVVSHAFEEVVEKKLVLPFQESAEVVEKKYPFVMPSRYVWTRALVKYKLVPSASAEVEVPARAWAKRLRV